jgi:hypothetical protein
MVAVPSVYIIIKKTSANEKTTFQTYHNRAYMQYQKVYFQGDEF